MLVNVTVSCIVYTFFSGFAIGVLAAACVFLLRDEQK